MRNLLKISLAMNGVALAGIVILWKHHWGASGQIMFQTQNARLAASFVPPQSSQNMAQLQVVREFDWSQIESADYPTYVANLRKIGCPEQTLRDIIVADVDTLYAPRRARLEQMLSNGGSSFGQSARPVETELLQLRKEEAALIATLLGGNQPANLAEPLDSNVVAGIASTVQLPQPPPSDTTLFPLSQKIVMPLAFQPVDPSILNLKPEQLAAINLLRENFMTEIGGANQTPDDPTYLKRWRRAQPAADEMMQGLMGVEAFENYQIAAYAAQKYGTGEN